MKMEARSSYEMLVVLGEARAMQANEGARMIRAASKAFSKAIARVLHVQQIAVGHTTAG